VNIGFDKQKEVSLNRITIFICAMIFFLLPIPNARGAMVKLSLEQLVQDADLIILGTVESVESRWVAGKIFSFATVSVSSTIKGELESGQGKVTVKFPGGKIGEIDMKVEDSPDYKPGEYTLVFLQKIPNQLYYMTLGSSQGKYLIKDDIVVRENLPLNEFLEKFR
jgi:hypothetical protein